MIFIYISIQLFNWECATKKARFSLKTKVIIKYYSYYICESGVYIKTEYTKKYIKLLDTLPAS
jgi:hypothetical protein